MLQTLREDPQDAEIDSHRLMVRAGIVRKLAGGLYAYLPLGMRVLGKIQRIVREEMDRAGALEICLPILQPAELWRQSGRWETMGPGMFRVRDRAGREYSMAPTAEETVTEVVRGIVDSYRQLPVTVYQIQWKFRDEIRPRFGLMRSKEFLMKDAYSFDTSLEAADRSYAAMFEAYKRIFARCGLEAHPVEADTGDIGGKSSHEFHVLAEAGEDGIAFCDSCAYAANLEKAGRRVAPRNDAECPAAEPVPTPGAKTIAEVSALLGREPGAFVKSLVYCADGRPVMVCVPGDREVNEVKLRRFLGAGRVELAPHGTVSAVCGAPAGFVGPVAPADPSLRIVADLELRGARGRIVGANREDAHLRDVDLARDARIADADYADLTVVRDGDVCERCGRPLKIRRGIEVGHVFKLGTKYTDAFAATFKTAQLKSETMVMGCYGIGVSRTLQAIVEQSHDRDGIVWPAAVAPYQVGVCLLDPDRPEAAEAAGLIERELEARGVDVLVDDRAERPGVKFKDADLIGLPVRVVVGARGLAAGGVEIKRRADGKDAVRVVAPADAAEAICGLLGR